MIKTLKQTKSAQKLIAVGAAVCIATAAMAYAPTDSSIAPDDALAYTQKEQIVTNGHGSLSPSYLVIHETANPGASAKNHVNYWSNTPAYAVHYVMDLDGDVVYHTMADNRKAWHVGNGNAYTVGIELCHATNQADFNSQWTEAVKWAGDYLKAKGWGIDRLMSHNEAALRWGGSDHTDPVGYFAQYGKTWAQFKADVQSYMNTGKVSGSAGQTTGGSTLGGSTSAHTSTGFGGTYTCMVNDLQIRTAPTTNSVSVGDYDRGQTVVLDDWYKIADGWVWGKYTAYSGNVRYIAVGKPTGGVSADDYLIKGGKVTSSTSGSKSGGWYEVDVNSVLNVRTGPGTSYRITGQLRGGYKLYVQSINSGWAKYQAYSGTRYVSAQYLDAA